MEPTSLAGVSLAINTLLGFVMYFMKQANDAQKERVDKLETHVQHLSDTAFKKEDFRDFRDQLWTRLDRMETDFKQQLLEFKKL